MSDGNGEMRKRACLGMPSIGGMTAGAAKGFYRASQGKIDVVGRKLKSEQIPLELAVNYSQGSLLACGFNILWCWVLNQVHRGHQVDYFAMLHADVEPEDWWLDKLIAELEARELDVLGVAVPIKDPHGLTSLALDRPDGNTWRPLCRLTMRELYRLPETFTSADLGHPLLINTGCWVVRWNQDLCKKVYFTVNDSIAFDPERGIFFPRVEPEDWFVSRLFHELGLKIGATRKVRLDHTGPMRFTNTAPWGDFVHDADYLKESLIPAQDPGGWRFPYEVEGWLTYEEGKALSELAKGKRVLEIGSYCGRSTVCLAQTAERVYAVDPGDGRDTPKPRDTTDDLEANLRRYGVRDKVAVITGTLEDVGWHEGYRPVDVVFIDGAHDAESVRRDVAGARERLAPGGVLVFHDYREYAGQHDGRWDPGVTEAVAELLDAGGALLSRHETLAVVRPPALEGATV